MPMPQSMPLMSPSQFYQVNFAKLTNSAEFLGSQDVEKRRMIGNFIFEYVTNTLRQTPTMDGTLVDLSAEAPKVTGMIIAVPNLQEVCSICSSIENLSVKVRQALSLIQ